ncbi:iron-dependent repressor IdeR/DtxR [Cutibacterium acnes JCM 18918]|nr:iron-dependent repressor IdeR/DtxR [Cutibacterium acnes JCM 18918]
MYLRTFYELLEEGVELRRARIVERLHQSGPTVSQTVARMERDGLVVVESDRSISLTQEGHDVLRLLCASIAWPSACLPKSLVFVPTWCTMKPAAGSTSFPAKLRSASRGSSRT